MRYVVEYQIDDGMYYHKVKKEFTGIDAARNAFDYAITVAQNDNYYWVNVTLYSNNGPEAYYQVYWSCFKDNIWIDRVDEGDINA